MDASNIRLAGYAYLLNKYQFNAISNWHISYVSQSSTLKANFKDGITEEIYPSAYWPGESTCDHLEFAIKYDGINLGILNQVFELIDCEELLLYIKSKPTGKYSRRIWFLYEFLSGRQLPLDNLTKGNYTEILEPEMYYTIEPGEKVPRQRIINNLLGTKDFCPIVRRSSRLKEMESLNLFKHCEEIIRSYSAQLLRRALSYLYTKETKSSFEIEHIKPSASRTEKFISLLELAEKQDFCEKQLLIDVQNRIVDPRFNDHDYRTSQNYVGQTVAYQKELIHYVCPRPDDLPDLMAGLILAHQKMKNCSVSAIIHAAAIAYGFVFLHPFEDGNGRIHRFLIHNIFSIRGVIPQGLMFPVSAAILKNPLDYDKSLEAFSKPLLKMIEYTLDNTGKMVVQNNTAGFYRYMDMTPQAEALSGFVKLTIDQELVEELSFLANYDKTKQALQEIIDMPDRLIDLFIQLCLQNNGTLSERKRTAHFDFLTAEELKSMEKVVQSGYQRFD